MFSPALHTIGVFDEPHMFFLHLFADGDPIAISKMMKEALDRTNSQ
jgi:hypothetical protein